MYTKPDRISTFFHLRRATSAFGGLFRKTLRAHFPPIQKRIYFAPPSPHIRFLFVARQVFLLTSFFLCLACDLRDDSEVRSMCYVRVYISRRFSHCATLSSCARQAQISSGSAHSADISFHQSDEKLLAHQAVQVLKISWLLCTRAYISRRGILRDGNWRTICTIETAS